MPRFRHFPTQAQDYLVQVRVRVIVYTQKGSYLSHFFVMAMALTRSRSLCLSTMQYGSGKRENSHHHRTLHTAACTTVGYIGEICVCVFTRAFERVTQSVYCENF